MPGGKKKVTHKVCLCMRDLLLRFNFHRKLHSINNSSFYHPDEHRKIKVLLESNFVVSLTAGKERRIHLTIQFRRSIFGNQPREGQHYSVFVLYCH